MFHKFCSSACLNYSPVSFSGAKYCTPEVIDTLVHDVCSLGEKSKFVRFHRDINSLLDVEHAKNLSPTVVNSYLDKLNSTSSSVDMSQFSDDDLFSAIKSRFCQSQCEVSAYVAQLDSLQSSLRSSLHSDVTSKIDKVLSSKVVSDDKSSSD